MCVSQCKPGAAAAAVAAAVAAAAAAAVVLSLVRTSRAVLLKCFWVCV